MKSPRFAVLVMLSLSFFGYSQGSASPRPQAAGTHTIGGTVTGLSGSIVLQNNGGDNLTVSEDGDFTFPKPVASGGDYNVTILTQPKNQICKVADGRGKAHDDVTSVEVSCAAGPQKMPS